MDMDQKDSWYSLTTEITHRDRPAVSAPKDISLHYAKVSPISQSRNVYKRTTLDTFRTVGYWLEECGIWFAIFLFIKLIIDIIVTVMRTLEIHRITGRSVSFGKVLLSARYKLFMVSILNSIYSPAKPIESSTPIAVEMQESTEHIYPSNQTQPNKTPKSFTRLTYLEYFPF